MQSAYLTAKQLAEMAGCAKITVQKYIEKGKLKAFRQGRYGQQRTGRHIILAMDAARFVDEFRSRKTVNP
jgi:excisionase family DNA binding protein